MRSLVFIFAVLLTISSGCFLLEGSLRRGNSSVLLMKDHPQYVEKDAQDKPMGAVGNLPNRKGETINTIGFYSGGLQTSYFLVVANKKEVYISRADVLTPDDQLYQSLGSKFKLKPAEDYAAWSRALQYVKNQSSLPLEIANDNLIKSKSTHDTASVSYIITRVPGRMHVEYEIVCQSNHKDFYLNAEANQVAFYMVTGRVYKRVE